MIGRITLLLGGARSGKSAWAERLAEQTARPVVYLATAVAGDAEMTDRIARHQAARPISWRTIEEPLAVAEAVRQGSRAGDVIIVDCLTLWVSNVVIQAMGDETDGAAISSTTWRAIEANLLMRLDELFEAASANGVALILVSNEVGLGLVPPYPLGRQYRDILGRINCAVAARADPVLFLIAGLPIDLGRLVPPELRSLLAESNAAPEGDSLASQ